MDTTLDKVLKAQEDISNSQVMTINKAIEENMREKFYRYE